MLPVVYDIIVIVAFACLRVALLFYFRASVVSLAGEMRADGSGPITRLGNTQPLLEMGAPAQLSPSPAACRAAPGTMSLAAAAAWAGGRTEQRVGHQLRHAGPRSRYTFSAFRTRFLVIIHYDSERIDLQMDPSRIGKSRS